MAAGDHAPAAKVEQLYTQVWNEVFLARLTLTPPGSLSTLGYLSSRTIRMCGIQPASQEPL